MENEIWKDVVGYEGLYQVSNLGKLKSLKKTIIKSKGGKFSYPEKIMKTKFDKNYERVGLSKNGVKKYFLVHRIVAIAFLNNLNNKKTVNHINGVKSDNRVQNLEWNTLSENIKHAFDTKLKIPIMGEKHYSTKISDEIVLKIKNEHKNLKQIEIAKLYSLSKTTISNIINGKRRKYIKKTELL